VIKLNNIVENLLKEFVGGEKYFDKLDEVLRFPENFDIIYQLFSTLNNENVIMSGKFGYYVLELFDKGLIPLQSLIVVNGSLRNGFVNKIDTRNLKEYEGYIFVDDSFYKGRTRDKVADFLTTINCSLTATHVVYDGSLLRNDKVFSLYRYHS
jgi:hypothetical protein